MLPAFGLYTHIQSNRRRSIALLLGLFFLIYVLAYALALLVRALVFDAPGASVEDYLTTAWRDLLWAAPWVTLGTLLWVSLSYWLHQAIIDAVTGSDQASRAAEPRLFDLLENLCISRGMTPPRLRILEVPALNAFATGLDADQYAITVTRGLLDALDERELEAVLAHELTHIRNEDVRMMVVAVVITGIISFVGELIFRRLPSSDRDDGGSSGSSRSSGGKGSGGAFAAVAIALALLALAWGLSLVIRFALSRSREYLADAGAVELTKNPDALISALGKIAGRGELEGVPSSVMEMCVDNPRSGFADLFATHPSVEDRVAALVRYAGAEPPAPQEPWPEAPAAPSIAA